jgi:hypothetical protein
MQIIGCSIALGGDDGQIVVREAHNPVSYPELLILKSLHGDENVRDVVMLGEDDRDLDGERQRLLGIYGLAAVTTTFPVQHMPLPEGDPRLAKKAAAAAAAAAKAAKEDPFDGGGSAPPAAGARGSLADALTGGNKKG